jgi:GntR family transcriptional regulator
LSGAWELGHQLPTIRELCELHGVSRSVVVQALALLDRERLLTRHQGKGIFVAEPNLQLEQGPALLLSFTEEILRRGHVPSSRTLRVGRTTAPASVAAALELEVGATVVLIERLRLADGLPMGFQRAHLLDRLFSGLAETDEPIDSLYQLLQRRVGVLPAMATETYEPILLDRWLACWNRRRVTRPSRSDG